MMLYWRSSTLRLQLGCDEAQRRNEDPMLIHVAVVAGPRRFADAIHHESKHRQISIQPTAFAPVLREQTHELRAHAPDFLSRISILHWHAEARIDLLADLA